MKFFRIIRAVLREVLEEASYERFCVREKIGISRESYKLFLQESDQMRQRKVRCC